MEASLGSDADGADVGALRILEAKRSRARIW
jgi:hypothetical protein